MGEMTNELAILLLSCEDRSGLVSRISHFVFERGGNIVDLDEHVAADEGVFSVRVAWELRGFSVRPEHLNEAFAPLGREFEAEWKIHLTGDVPKLAVFVSRYDHCLQDLLWRHKARELDCELKLIISNHSDLEPLARFYDIPFYVFPKTKKNRKEQENAELRLLEENEIDTVVLARYMQILSEEFVAEYPNQIINIHHSFLPAFIGGNPYRQAYERGVKIVGATSHYVTADLDEGPIIEQDVIRVSHRDAVQDMIRKGRDLERVVLARALRAHLARRVLVSGAKTVVFE
ncbi:MAG: formyltetrahydrofolate deformylase [Acidobacteriota bacterium]|nr:MAG: formyltetrahydrofolate deformylase [Acidobacteriota bacterium]